MLQGKVLRVSLRTLCDLCGKVFGLSTFNRKERRSLRKGPQRTRIPRFSVMTKTLILLGSAVLLIHAFGPAVLGQGSGNIKGTVRVASGAPVAGVAVIATNQVSGKWKRTRSGVDGTYSFRLSAGVGGILTTRAF